MFLDDKYPPLSNEIGFLKCPARHAADNFISWQRDIHKARGVSLEVREVVGHLRDCLRLLLPLTSVERRRYIFIPLLESPWCAYFDNGHQGGDPASAVSFLAERISCEGLRASYVPHSIDVDPRGGAYGAVIFELYGTTPNPVLNVERTIYVAHNGSKWEFGQSGAPLPFEDMSAYRSKRVRDRFTPELLIQYLDRLGIPNPYDANSYASTSSEPALLIEKQGGVLHNTEEFWPSELKEVVS